MTRYELPTVVRPVTAAAIGLTLAFSMATATIAANAKRGQSDEEPAKKTSEERDPKSNLITVQPNLGDLDFDGGVKFAPNGKYIAVSNRKIRSSFGRSDPVARSGFSTTPPTSNNSRSSSKALKFCRFTRMARRDSGIP